MLSHEYYKTGNKSNDGKNKGLLKTVLTAFGIALFLKIFLFEAYKVPTNSMVPTIKPRDHIIVNKFIYGVKIPVLGWKLPALSSPDRGDIIVFQAPTYKSVGSFKQFINLITFGIFSLDNTTNNPKNFVKRTIGISGDTISIKKSSSVNNGTKTILRRSIIVNGKTLKRKFLKRITYKSDIGKSVADKFLEYGNEDGYAVQYIDNGEVIKGEFYVPKEGDVVTLKWVEPGENYKSDIPEEALLPGQKTHFALPDKYDAKRNYIVTGTVIMNINNRRIIKINGSTFDSLYNNPSNRVFPNKLVYYLLKGKDIKYRFNENYYFVMGDNRDRSEDSRYWGLLRQELIIGSPLMVYFPFSRMGSLR